jgi:hypothetical protein
MAGYFTSRTRAVGRALRVGFILGLTAVLSALLAPPASAEKPPLANIEGFWKGVYMEVIGGPHLIDGRAVTMSIDQHQQRVSGELSVPDPVPPGVLFPGCDFPVSGGVTPGSVLVSDLKLGGQGCGATIAVTAGVLVSKRGSGGSLDGTLSWALDDGRAAGSGHLIMIRHYKGVLNTDILGRWLGLAVSDVTGEPFAIDADFIIDPNQKTGFLGRMSFSTARDTVIDGAVLGTNRRADGGTLIIAAGPQGVLSIAGRQVDPHNPHAPPAIRGDYLLRLPDGTNDFGTLEIEHESRVE